MCVCVCARVWILRWLVRVVLAPQPAHLWVTAAVPLHGAASLGAGAAPRLAGLARQAASVPIAGTYGCGEGGSACMFFPEETKLKLFSGEAGGKCRFSSGADGMEGGCWCQGQDRRRGMRARGSRTAACMGYMARDAPGHGTGPSPPRVTAPRGTPAPVQLRGGGLAVSWAPVEDVEHLPSVLRWGLAMHEQPLLLLFLRRCLQADGGLSWRAYMHCGVCGGSCCVPSPFPVSVLRWGPALL